MEKVKVWIPSRCEHLPSPLKKSTPFTLGVLFLQIQLRGKGGQIGTASCQCGSAFFAVVIFPEEDGRCAGT